MPEQPEKTDEGQSIDLPFPEKGIDESGAYSRQEPATSPDMLNMLVLDSRTKRKRGGSRHGSTVYSSALFGTNAVQCLIQANASKATVPVPTSSAATNTTITPQPGPSTTNTVVASSTAAGQAALSAPPSGGAPTTLTGPASNFQMAPNGDGTVVLPGDGTDNGYVMIVPTNSGGTWSATKTAYRNTAPKATYLGSAWTQDNRCVILTRAQDATGASTLSTAIYSSLIDSDTTIQVTNGGVFATPAGTSLTTFVVQIDSEQIKVASVSGNALAVTTRGYNGTVAASHAQGAIVTLIASSPLSAVCNSGVTSAVTTLNVSNAAPFYPAVPFSISVESELLRVTAKSGTALTVTRGAHSTTGAQHATGLPVTLYGKTTLNTALDSSLSSVGTSIVVADGSAFPSSGAFAIRIDSEDILIGSRSSNTLTVTTRGFNSTTAAAHAVGSTIRSATTTLAAACLSGINTTATTFKVGSTTPFPFSASGSYSVKVDSEVMTVGANGLDATNKQFTVTRAASPETHSTGATVVPYASTTLSADALSGITAAETSLIVASLTSFPTSGTFAIQIDNEYIKVSAQTVATKTLTGLTRAQSYTTAAGVTTSTAAAHKTGRTVSLFAINKLSAAITSTTATGFTVTSAALFPSVRSTTVTHVVQIGSEQMLVTGGALTSFMVVRGFNGTTAATHLVGDMVRLIPQGTTTVASTGATALTVTAPNPSQFPTTGQFNVLVGTERMTCTRTSSTSLAIVTRGVAGSNGVLTTIDDHFTNDAVDLDTVAVGGSAATYSSTTMTTNNVTTVSVTLATLLPVTTGYQIKLDGEEMTVTGIAANVLTVTRANPVDHATTLSTVSLKTPVTTTLTGTPSTSVVVTDAATFPTTATGNPFTIKIEQEQITVTSVSGNTFTVTRGSNGTSVADHASGVDITIAGSTGTATVADTGDTTLTVTDAKLFPFAVTAASTTGLNYPIVVDSGNSQSEVMTVTAINTSTNVITVTRTAALAKDHGNGAIVSKNFNASSGLANAGGNSVVVASASSFPGSALLPFTIQIDNEQMSVTSISSNTFTVIRATNGQIGNHAVNAAVAQVGLASKQQVQYEVRDKAGTVVTAATSLFVITAGSPIYGMVIQGSTTAAQNFVWIWAGAVTAMSITDFATPAPVTGNDKQMVLKLALSTAGVLSTSGGLVIGPKGGTSVPKLVAGISVSTSNVARHGALTILSGGTTPRIVLAETGGYPIADSNYVTTHLQGYRCDTGVAIDPNLLTALPSGTFTGACATVPQQLIAMGQRTDKEQLLLSAFNQTTPSSSNSYDVLATYPFPNTLASPTAITTAITGSTVASQTLSAQEVPIIDQKAEQYTSVAYNGDTNTALVVHRTAGGTTPHARIFSMLDGGAGATGNPLSAANLEWCAPAPWGWIAAGYTGGADVIGLSHSLTQLWSATVGYTAAANIKAGAANYVRLMDYATGLSGRLPASYNYSRTAFSITERTYGSFTVSLGVAPDPGTTVSITFTSGTPAKALVSATQSGTQTTSVTLSWTAADYSTAKSVFVFGAAAGAGTVTITATVVTQDPRFAALNPQDVLVNVDVATSGYAFGATTGSVNEGGSTLVIPMRLMSIPTASVTISLSSSDTAKATVSPASLVFPASGAASTDQNITITGGTVTADSTVTIITTQSSADVTYNALNPSDLTITVVNVPVAYTFGATTGSVKEGSTLQIGLHLGRAPTSNVVVTFTSSNTARATVTSSLTFTSANYATTQYLTITGVVDGALNGNASVTITGAVVSSDSEYQSLAVSSLTITVEDVQQASAHVLTTLAVAGGTLFDVSLAASPATISGGTFNTARVVRAASLGYLVLFADGTSKLMFDAVARQLKAWTPSAGAFPSANGNTPQCVETWRDRVIQFGMNGDPQNYWATRRFTWDNWTYPAAGSISDVDAPFNGNLTKAGLFPGGVMTGLIPYNNDLAILGGDNGLYQWSGDPAAGAVFDDITSAAGVGMAFGHAWCKDPLGQVYFFGRTGGVYRLRLNTPAEIKTDRITTLGVERMLSVDLDAYVPTLMWDNYLQGVHVFLTPFSLAATPYWYFFDAGTEGWFKCRFAADAMHPLATIALDGDSSNDRKMAFGTRDGRILYLDPAVTSDAGTAFNSYMVVGPVSQPPGKVMVESVQADQTGLATWSVLAGETPELALAAPGVSLGTMSTNITNRRRVRGRVLYFKGTRATGPWSMERINVSLTKTRN